MKKKRRARPAGVSTRKNSNNGSGRNDLEGSKSSDTPLSRCERSETIMDLEDFILHSETVYHYDNRRPASLEALSASKYVCSFRSDFEWMETVPSFLYPVFLRTLLHFRGRKETLLPFLFSRWPFSDLVVRRYLPEEYYTTQFQRHDEYPTEWRHKIGGGLAYALATSIRNFPNFTVKKIDFRGVEVEFDKLRLLIDTILEYKVEAEVWVDLIVNKKQDLMYLCRALKAANLNISKFMIQQGSCFDPHEDKEIENIIAILPSKHLVGLSLAFLFPLRGKLFQNRLSSLIMNMKGLRHLDLSKNALNICSNRHLIRCTRETLSVLPNLLHLNLSSNRFTRCLQHVLGGISHGLESLNISSCCLKLEDISFLRNSIHADTLIDLDLSYNTYIRGGFEDLFSQLAKLRVLTLVECKLMDEYRKNVFDPYISVCSELAKLPDLQFLTVISELFLSFGYETVASKVTARLLEIKEALRSSPSLVGVRLGRCYGEDEEEEEERDQDYFMNDQNKKVYVIYVARN